MTIKQALYDVRYPVVFGSHIGKENTYLTYHYIGQTGTIYADGKEAETGSMFALDYFTNVTPFTDAIQAIKTALESGGYIVVVEAATFEEETDLYHISMTARTADEVYC